MKPKTEMAKKLDELTEQFRRLKSECDGISDSYVSLRSEYDEQAKQLAAANELLSSIRQENRRLAMAVASQTGRIAELERQTEAWSGYHDVADLYEGPAKPELEGKTP